MINEYCFDELIIGGSYESLLYSFFCNKKILLLKPILPFKLDTVEYFDGLRSLSYDRDESINKLELWDRLAFILSMAGNIVCPNTIKSSRFNDNEIVLITEHNKRIKIHCDNLIVFDNIIEDEFKVYDWFNVRSGNNHTHTTLVDDDNFVSKVYFYRSNRIGSNRNIKDLVSESSLSESELRDINYCEGIARIKILKMMKEAGIKGQSNGTSKSGYKLHYAVKIEHTHRQLIQKYSCIHDVDELSQLEPHRGDQWNITKKLFRHKQISTLQESFRLPANL